MREYSETEDVIELGAVSTETHGLALLGPIDPQQGAFYPVPGIVQEDD